MTTSRQPKRTRVIEGAADTVQRVGQRVWQVPVTGLKASSAGFAWLKMPKKVFELIGLPLVIELLLSSLDMV